MALHGAGFSGGNVMGHVAGKEPGLLEDAKTRKREEEHVAFLLRAWYKFPWRQREERAFSPKGRAVLKVLKDERPGYRNMLE